MLIKALIVGETSAWNCSVIILKWAVPWIRSAPATAVLALCTSVFELKYGFTAVGERVFSTEQTHTIGRSKEPSVQSL